VASRRGSAIEAALTKKGFRLDESRDHRYLVLYIEGRDTGIRTKVSHGSRDYGDDLLSKVQKELRLPTKRDLLGLIDCPLSGDAYVGLLRERGVV